VDVADKGVEPLVGRYPLSEPGKCAVKNERLGSLGVAGREEGGEGSAFGYSELSRALDAHCVHDGTYIIHSLVQRGQVRHTVRQAGAPFVEQDHARKAAELAEPPGQARFVPVVFDVRDESRCYDEVTALTENLIGDVNIAALGIVRGGLHVGFSTRTYTSL